MSSLQDIQLQIIVAVQGATSLSGLSTSLNAINTANLGVTKSADAVNTTNWQSVKSWGQLNTNIKVAEQNMDAVFRAGLRLQQTGMILEGLGKAGLGFFEKAAGLFGAYEQGLIKVAAGGGIFDKSSAMYGRLDQTIKDTATDLKMFPVQDVTKGFYYWITTTGQQIKTLGDLQTAQQGVEAAMKTAAITQTDYESAIKGAYSITKQYGLGLSAIPRVLAELHIETNRTSLEFPDLIQSFKFMGPLAHSLGMSFEDVASTMGMIGDAGQRGSQAGRGFAMFLTKMVKPTKDNKAALNDLFLQTEGVHDAWDKMVFKNGSFVGMHELVNNLAGALSGMTQQEKLEYLTRIASTQNAARVILPLIDQQIEAFKHGADIFNDPKYSVTGAMDLWQKQWNNVSDSWAGIVGTLQRIVEIFLLNVGARVAEVFTPLLKQAGAWLQLIDQWLQKNPQVMDLIVKIGVAISGALVLVGALLSISGLGLVVYASFSVISAALGTVIAPIMVVIGLIAGLAAAWATNVGGIRTAVNHLLAVIHTIFGPMTDNINLFSSWQGAAKLAGDIVTAVATHLANGIDRLATYLQKLNQTPGGHKFLQGLATVLGLLGQYVPAVLGLGAALGALSFAAGGLMVLGRVVGPVLSFATGIGTLTKLAGSVASVGVSIVPSLIGLGGTILGALGPVGWITLGVVAGGAALAVGYQENWFGLHDMLQPVLDWFQQTVLPFFLKWGQDALRGFQILADGVGTVFQRILDPIQKLINNNLPAIQGGLDAFGQHLQGVLDSISSAWDAVWNQTLGPAVDAFVAKFSGWGATIGSILSKLGPIWDDLVQIAGFLAGVLFKAVDLIVQVAGPVLGFLTTVIGQILAILLPVISTVIDLVLGAINTVLAVIQGVLDIIVGVITGDWDKVVGVLRGAWDTIVSIVTGAINTVLSIIGGVLNTILGIVQGVWNNILSFIGSVWTNIKNAVDGALKTIQDTIHNAFNFIHDTIQNALNAVHDIVWGIIDGIVHFLGGNTDKLKQIVSDAFNAIKTTISNVLNAIHDTFWGIVNGIVSFAVTQFTNIKNAIDTQIHNALTLIQNVLNTISTTFHTIIDGIVNWIRSRFTDVANTGHDLVQKLLDGISGMANTVIGIGKSIVDWIVNGVRGIWNDILNIGNQIVTGIWNGLIGMKDWIVNKIRDFINSIIPGPIKDILGIHSPSKVTAELGRYVVLGLAQGILATQDAKNAMVSTVQGVADAAKGLDNIHGLSMLADGGGFSVETESRRVIELRLSIESPDGSVSQVDMDRLAGLLQGSTLVDALEHAASSD